MHNLALSYRTSVFEFDAQISGVSFGIMIMVLAVYFREIFFCGRLSLSSFET
jgi:hypothetical protein